jgi:pimeloyl-ACP methyl ester carboxylesterase
VADALAKISASALREPAPVEISPTLKTLTKRLLIIRGVHDTTVSAGETPAGAQLQTLTHSGHMPHLEEPDRVNGLLLEHFAIADSADAGIQ